MLLVVEDHESLNVGGVAIGSSVEEFDRVCVFEVHHVSRVFFEFRPPVISTTPAYVYLELQPVPPVVIYCLGVGGHVEVASGCAPLTLEPARRLLGIPALTFEDLPVRDNNPPREPFHFIRPVVPVIAEGAQSLVFWGLI